MDEEIKRKQENVVKWESLYLLQGHKKYDGSIASQAMTARPSGKGKFKEWLRFGK